MKRIILGCCLLLQLSSMAQSGIFNGGLQDGYNTFLQEATLVSPSIFNGGKQDGYGLSTLTPSQAAPSIFNGGWQDGYAAYNHNATLPAPSIFNGGWQDGYATFPESAPACLPPTTLQHLGNSGTTIRLGWTSGSGNLSYQIMLVRQSSTDTFWLSGPITGSSMSDTFTCLPTGTFFSYFIRESCGSGGYSPWVNGFSTYTSPGCAAPSTQTNTIVNAQNANLSWTNNTFNTTPYQISYGVGIGSPAQGTKTSWIIPTLVNGNTHTHALFLSGGVGNISWYVRQVCGPCDTTAWVGPNILPSVSCSPAATNTMSVTSLATISATLNWTSTNYNSSSKIELQNVGNSTSVFYSQNANVSYSRSLVLTALMANTDYRWRVKEYCSVGDSSAYSNWQNFTTPANGGGSCAAPTNQASYTASGQVFIGKWSSALYGDNTKRYQVSYGMNIGSPSQGTIAGNAYYISQTPLFPTHFFATGNVPGFTWFVRDICNPGDTSAWTGPFVVGSNKMDEPGLQQGVETPEFSFNIYPNPNSGKWLAAEWESPEIPSLQIYDVTGRMVIERTLIHSPESLELDHLQKGVYSVVFSNSGLVLVKRLVIE